MADKIWNGSIWIDDTGTGGGGAPTYHTHTIDQIAGLQAELDAFTDAAPGTAPFAAAVLAVVDDYNLAAVILEASGTYTVPPALPAAFTRIYVGVSDATALPGFREQDLYLKVTS